jgi:hypothetical protein
MFRWGFRKQKWTDPSDNSIVTIFHHHHFLRDHPQQLQFMTSSTADKRHRAQKKTNEIQPQGNIQATSMHNKETLGHNLKGNPKEDTSPTPSLMPNKKQPLHLPSLENFAIPSTTMLHHTANTVETGDNAYWEENADHQSIGIQYNGQQWPLKMLPLSHGISSMPPFPNMCQAQSTVPQRPETLRSQSLPHISIDTLFCSKESTDNFAVSHKQPSNDRKNNHLDTQRLRFERHDTTTCTSQHQQLPLPFLVPQITSAPSLPGGKSNFDPNIRHVNPTRFHQNDVDVDVDDEINNNEQSYFTSSKCGDGLTQVPAILTAGIEVDVRTKNTAAGATLATTKSTTTTTKRVRNDSSSTENEPLDDNILWKSDGLSTCSSLDDWDRSLSSN